MRVICKCEKCPYHDSRGYCTKRLVKIGVMGTCEVIWNEYSIRFNEHNFPESCLNQIQQHNEVGYYVREDVNIAETQVKSGEEEVVSSSDEATTAAPDEN